MSEMEPNDSVRKEQFGTPENMEDNMEQPNAELSANELLEQPSEDPPVEAGAIADETVDAALGDVKVSETVEALVEPEGNTPPSSSEDEIGSDESTGSSNEADHANEVVAGGHAENDSDDDDDDNDDEHDHDGHMHEEDEEEDIQPSADYSKLRIDQVVNTLEIIVQTKPVNKAKADVEALRALFYKYLNDDLEEKKKAFIEAGGNEEEFLPEENPLETRVKNQLIIYRDKRTEFAQQQEMSKQSHLDEKYKIIDAIKELVNSQESLNQTFQDFRDLQDKWRSIGPVPQASVKDLWEKYHFQVEAFYDYIKINKELRDLDLKKNLEVKMQLCEKAEQLFLEPSVVEAFRMIQVLHHQWRETGPVPADKRAEIWERFKDATSKINKRHQEYFVNLKQEQKKNLEEKTLLCEKVEEIVQHEIDTARDWEEKSKEVIELQKVWKTIGFAPKRHNTKVYERFRKACDEFFNQKREFFSQNREEQQNNLQLKTELCIQAESLKDNTDWKKTTDEFIALQKKWKQIGSVPNKVSDKIWKRFRAACDHFFNAKSKFYSTIDTTYDDNLKLKLELIKEIDNYILSDDVQESLNALKQFQRRWAEIGFVPFKMKDDIQEQYRAAINTKFDKLKIDEDDKSLLKFRSRVESIISKPNAQRRLAMEREKCVTKLSQMQNDITLWENNIGFFSNSKNAESLIRDVEHKIESAQRKIEVLQEKINIIDEYDD